MIPKIARRAIPMWQRFTSNSHIMGNRYLFGKYGSLEFGPNGLIVFGRNVEIERGAQIYVAGTLTIGDNVFIGRNATIACFSDIRIEDDVLIGENCSIHDEDHGDSSNRATLVSSPIVVGRKSWLGAGVVVTRGVIIGPNATVGANAVVTRDVEQGCTVGGVPARGISKSLGPVL